MILPRAYGHHLPALNARASCPPIKENLLSRLCHRERLRRRPRTDDRRPEKNQRSDQTSWPKGLDRKAAPQRQKKNRRKAKWQLTPRALARQVPQRLTRRGPSCLTALGEALGELLDFGILGLGATPRPPEGEVSEGLLIYQLVDRWTHASSVTHSIHSYIYMYAYM